MSWFSTGLELSQAEYRCFSQKKHWPQAMVKGTTTRWSFFSVDLRPRLDDPAHELVAEDVAGQHAGNDAVVEVEVGAADRRRGDLDDGVARVHDLGIGYGVDADVVLAVPGECAHGLAPQAADLWLLEVAISPVSISILKRLSSRRPWMAGSFWKIVAIHRPSSP